MQDRAQGHAFAPEDVDFEAFYQGKPPVAGADFAFDVAPWDLGEPQPALAELEAGGQLRSDILDAGCGLGENALFLAERGYRVTGFDASPTAIERARERAGARGADLELVLADATRLDGVEQRFNTVVDSGLYHCLGEEQRTEYAAALHRVTRAGAQLHLLCFADTDSPGFRLPMQVSQDNLRTHLGGHWNIRSIDLTHFTTSFTREFFERGDKNAFETMGVDIDIDSFRTDGRGRVTVPAWQVHAVRN